MGYEHRCQASYWNLCCIMRHPTRVANKLRMEENYHEYTLRTDQHEHCQG